MILRQSTPLWWGYSFLLFSASEQEEAGSHSFYWWKECTIQIHCMHCFLKREQKTHNCKTWTTFLTISVIPTGLKCSVHSANSSEISQFKHKHRELRSCLFNNLSIFCLAIICCAIHKLLWPFSLPNVVSNRVHKVVLYHKSNTTEESNLAVALDDWMWCDKWGVMYRPLTGQNGCSCTHVHTLPCNVIKDWSLFEELNCKLSTEYQQIMLKTEGAPG